MKFVKILSIVFVIAMLSSLFVSCAGVLVGGTFAALGSFKVRDLETQGLVDIPDEAFMGENPEVDFLNLSALQLVDEMKYLTSLGDDLNLNYLQNRYDLILPKDVDSILTDEAREMPLKRLLSSEGVVEVFSSVYIGHMQQFECRSMDSEELADPDLGKELTRWYDPKNDEYITGIGATIAYFSLADFIGGNIHVDAVLDGIVLADVLGYYYIEDEFGNKIWYDTSDAKVTGIMAIFADCTINDVSDRVNTVKIGQFLGYTEHGDGVWYEYDELSGTEKPISGFMSKIANSSINGDNNIGNVFNELTVGDIVDEEEREKGIFSIIPADTKITEIDSVVNSSITESPMQFFMNQGMVTFETTQQKLLDDICVYSAKYKAYNADDPDFIKYYKNNGSWTVNSAGKYLVPEWRCQPLNKAFSYVIGLLSTSTTP